ncbi:hypothetical protein KM043_001330, partial [Ampulex compressa]
QNADEQRVGDTCIQLTNETCIKWCRRHYTVEKPYSLTKERKVHPYRKLHPWTSEQAFCNHLLQHVIYNKDGLVALNKPYGISKNFVERSERYKCASHRLHFIPNQKEYALETSIPHIAQKLGYERLIAMKTPEKYMSGVVLLAANEHVQKSIEKSFARAMSMKLCARTYWVVTTMVPTSIKGKEHLAMQQKGKEKPIILKNWGKNQLKRNEVKILNVEYKVLSNSTLNLSSLIEIKSSTQKWHAIRMFTTLMLYAPVLGDNYYASEIIKILGTPVRAKLNIIEKPLPKVNSELLQMLKLTKDKVEIIPAHIHLKEICLPCFHGPKNDLRIEAPIPSYYNWTCEQLKFKYLKNDTEDNDAKDLRMTVAH